jgi:hypothetical protein
MKMPSAELISSAQIDVVSRLRWGANINPSECCWACGIDNIEPQRAHIVARSNGGSDDPTNFFLLCGRCHKRQPDAATQETQIQWLLSQDCYLEERAEQAYRLANAIRDASEELEADDILMDYLAGPFIDQLREVATTAIQKSGSTSPETVYANATWSFVDHFRRYVEFRRA